MTAIDIDVGDANEKRVLDLLLANRPAWVWSARQTRRCSDADRAGFDLLVQTDRGVLGVQVKSNARAGCQFRHDSPRLDRIAVVVVMTRGREVLDDAALTERILRELTACYEGRAGLSPEPLTARPFAALVVVTGRGGP